MRNFLTLLAILIPMQVSADIGITATTGLYIPAIITPSMQLSYKAEDYLIGIAYGQTTLDYSSREFALTEATFASKEIFGRCFITTTLNILGAVTQREVNLTSTASETTTYAHMEFLSASIGIGNYWVMRYGVTFGIDYVMINRIISSSLEVETTSDSEYVKEQESIGYQHVRDTFSDLINWNGLLLLTLGITF
jgi:hypothetical protein